MRKWTPVTSWTLWHTKSDRPWRRTQQPCRIANVASRKSLVKEARTALEDQADLSRLRALTTELRQVLQPLTASASVGAAAGASADPSETSSRETGGDSDDVIDAKFTTR